MRPNAVPPSSWARIVSGFTTGPQSIAADDAVDPHLARVGDRDLRDVRDVAAERLVDGDARGRGPPGSGLPQPAFSATNSSTRLMPRVLAEQRRGGTRTGPCRPRAPARRSSVSTTNAVCEWPTERHHSVGTPPGAWCQSTRMFGIA